MIYGSVCAGIEAATMAWHSLGWRPAFFSEIDRAARAVLQHHYPEVPLHGDFTTIQAGDYGPIQLLVGGTPCQDFSVAGLRKGLAGERGNLTLEYLKLAERLRPKWLAWENVPGVLSQDKGRAFGAFLGGLGELGYSFAYRVFDAQYVRVDILGRAVPQRRRRVFVVGYLGDWRRPAAVLFERESLRGNPPPRREAGKGIATSLAARAGGGGRPDGGDGQHSQLVAEPYALAVRGRGDGRNLEARQDGTSNAILTPNGGRDGIGVGAVAYVPEIMATAVTAKMAKGSSGPAGDEAYDLIAFDTTQITSPTNRSAAHGETSALAANAHPPAIAFSAKDYGNDASDEVSPTLRSGGFDKSHANGGVMPAIAHSLRAEGFDASEDGTGRGVPLIPTRWAVRRLTPRECERLQGFPDDFTLVPFRGKLMADGQRYKMLGNSMAVNVMRWIGQRIELVERMDNQFGGNL